MDEKYQGKYRIKSARNPNWDYGSNGHYFVTICTHKNQKYFGNIIDCDMRLSDIGEIADKCWIAIPEHFPFVKLHAYIIMPDHVHGIIEIAKKGLQNNLDVQTRHALSLSSNNKTIGEKRFRNPEKKSISSIIGAYKSAVTKNARLINPKFKWQARFHDHIIRNDKAFENISKYIIDNPKKWALDNI